MANRLLSNRIYTNRKDRKVIHAVVAIGGTGAPTLNAGKSPGVLSVTRNSAGKYTFVFGTSQNGANVLDPYYEFSGLSCTFDTTGASNANPAAPVVSVINDASATPATCAVQIICQKFTATSGDAADPASGEKMLIDFVFIDSSAP